MEQLNKIVQHAASSQVRFVVSILDTYIRSFKNLSQKEIKLLKLCSCIYQL